MSTPTTREVRHRYASSQKRRFTVFCAICAWVFAVSIAGTLAQIYGLWRWTPTPDAARAAAFFILAALVAVLFIPAEEVEEP